VTDEHKYNSLENVEYFTVLCFGSVLIVLFVTKDG
jgi:hypothetical protein